MQGSWLQLDENRCLPLLNYVGFRQGTQLQVHTLHPIPQQKGAHGTCTTDESFFCFCLLTHPRAHLSRCAAIQRGQNLLTVPSGGAVGVRPGGCGVCGGGFGPHSPPAIAAADSTCTPILGPRGGSTPPIPCGRREDGVDWMVVPPGGSALRGAPGSVHRDRGLAHHQPAATALSRCATACSWLRVSL